MTPTTAVVEIVDRNELRKRRQRLITRTGTTWTDLRQRAADYALTDDERSVYDAIRSIDWMLSHKP